MPNLVIAKIATKGNLHGERLVDSDIFHCQMLPLHVIFFSFREKVEQTPRWNDANLVPMGHELPSEDGI